MERQAGGGQRIQCVPRRTALLAGEGTTLDPQQRPTRKQGGSGMSGVFMGKDAAFCVFAVVGAED
ncbi:MAG: hypothetical protein C0443_13320 [Comamonadaceae bacterium]|nr:hypothetical protein [Comamonadaceae bacterium]